MPRKRRFYTAGVPAHIVQRGNGRQPVFLGPDDFVTYLQYLSEAANAHGCSLHAYVLMTNHVHLLMSPDDTDSISRTLQQLGRTYVTYFNRRYGRSGTLWEGRHKGAIIESSRYALNCYRYIELNPVRAGMVSSPGDYAWSSYQWNALGKNCRLAALPEFRALGSDDEERRRSYREFVAARVPDDETDTIRRCVQTGTALGSSEFRKHMEQMLGVPVGYDKRGRPGKILPA